MLFLQKGEAKVHNIAMRAYLQGYQDARSGSYKREVDAANQGIIELRIEAGHFYIKECEHERKRQTINIPRDTNPFIICLDRGDTIHDRRSGKVRRLRDVDMATLLSGPYMRGIKIINFHDEGENTPWIKDHRTSGIKDRRK